MWFSGAGGPFGAVVVRDGKIIATGANQVTTTNDPTYIAEVVAIRAACKALGDFQLKGCVVYTSCEPCPMCLSAIYWSRCDAIFFGNSAADATAAGFDDSFPVRRGGEAARPAPAFQSSGCWATRRLRASTPGARRQIRSNTDMAIKKTSSCKECNGSQEDRNRFGCEAE